MELMLEDVRERLEVSGKIFGRDFNGPLVHQVVVAYMARERSGTRARKGRGEVRGSGRKPWRQKGTGRARSGSLRSPIWRSGGATFTGSRDRNFIQKVNRKMYRGAVSCILSELVRSDRLLLFRSFRVEEPKTALLARKLRELGLGSVAIFLPEEDDALLRAARNLPGVEVCGARRINPLGLLRAAKVILTVGAVRCVEEILAP